MYDDNEALQSVLIGDSLSATLVLVEWEDAHNTSGWVTPDEFQAAQWAPVYVETIGWLLKRTEQVLVVASSIVREGAPQVRDLTTIPIGSILSLRAAEAIRWAGDPQEDVPEATAAETLPG